MNIYIYKYIYIYIYWLVLTININFHLIISVRLIFILNSRIVLSWLKCYILPFPIDTTLSLSILFMMMSSNEKNSALLAFCAGSSLVTGEFHSQRPVTRIFDVFVDLRMHQQLSKQWRRHVHYDVTVMLYIMLYSPWCLFTWCNRNTLGDINWVLRRPFDCVLKSISRLTRTKPSTFCLAGPLFLGIKRGFRAKCASDAQIVSMPWRCCVTR